MYFKKFNYPRQNPVIIEIISVYFHPFIDFFRQSALQKKTRKGHLAHVYAYGTMHAHMPKNLLGKTLLMTALACSLFSCSITSSSKEDIFSGLDESSVAPHQHTYSDAWAHDDTTHWHAATCEHTNLRSDEAAHSFTVTETPATYESEGEKVFRCSVCFYSKTEKLEKLVHGYSSEWSHDAYNHWHACTDEGYENIKRDLADHTYKVEVVDPTFEEDGLSTSTCLVCGYSYSVVLPKKEHAYGTEWTHDDKGHWHNCIDEGYGELQVDYGEHRYVETTIPATYEEEGLRTFECQDCGYSYSVEIDKLPHHYSTLYSSDDKGHWYACVDKGYETLRDGYGLHDYEKEVIPSSYTKKGYTIFTCKDCGYKYIGDETEILEHHHGEELINDAWGHWYACTDIGYESLKIDYEQHAYESSVVKEPSLNEDGLEKFECSECGFSYELTIDSFNKQAMRKMTFEKGSDGNYTITQVSGSTAAIYIPDEYEGKPVTRIASGALRCNFTELHLGKNIQEVDYWGLNYSNNKLEVLEINDNFTSMPFYLYNCSQLKTLILGAGITDIDRWMLTDLPLLESVEVSEKNGSYASIDGVIYNKDLTSLMLCPRAHQGELTIPSTVTTFGYCCFRRSDIETISFPEQLYAIDNCAFSECENLKTVTFTGGIQYVYSEAFRNCTSLEEIRIESSMQYISEGTFRGCEKLKKVYIGPDVRSFQKTWFTECSIEELTFDESNPYFAMEGGLLMNASKTQLLCPLDATLSSYLIPDSVTNIADGAFMETSIESLTIPEQVDWIGPYCFYGCSSLRSLNMASLQNNYVSSYLCMNCENLEEVVLPSNADSIGYRAFSGCKNLMTVSNLETVRQMEQYVFDECDKLFSLYNEVQYVGTQNSPYLIAYKAVDNFHSASLTLHEDCKIAASYCCSWNSYLKKLDLKNVERVCNYAFHGSYIEEIDFGSSLVSIEYSAFTQTCIQEAHLPDTLEEISDWVFQSCPNLETVYLPASLRYFSGYTFANCPKLTSIEIEEGNEHLENYKGSIIQKDWGQLIYSFAPLDAIIVPANVYSLYLNFLPRDYAFPITIYWEGSPNSGTPWWTSNDYSGTVSILPYSETSQPSCWHYVEGVATPW